MKTPLRTLTCALAVASAIAAAPAAANPGLQRATGGPGASATPEERRADDALARRQRADRSVPPDYLLPAVTTRGELGRRLLRRPHGRALVLAAGRGRALALPRGRGRQADAAGLPRHRHVRRRRSARVGHLPDAPRVGHGRDAGTRCSRTTAAQQTLNPVATKIVFSAEGSEKAERLDDAGPAARRARPRPTAAGRTRSTTRASTRSSTRCRSARAPGRPASSSRRRGAVARARCGCAPPPGNTLEVLSANGDVLATADLTHWKLALADAGARPRAWPAGSRRVVRCP